MNVLRDQSGIICTIFKKRYVSTMHENSMFLVQFSQSNESSKMTKDDHSSKCVKTENWLSLNGHGSFTFLDYIEKPFCVPFIWKNGSPVNHSDLRDGDKVSFDAISLDQDNYRTTIVWQGNKPSYTQIMGANNLLLSQNFMGTRVNNGTFSEPPLINASTEDKLEVGIIPLEPEFCHVSLGPPPLLHDLFKLIMQGNYKFKFICTFIHSNFFHQFSFNKFVQSDSIYIENEGILMEKTDNNWFGYYVVHLTFTVQNSVTKVSFNIKGKTFKYWNELEMFINEISELILKNPELCCVLIQNYLDFGSVPTNDLLKGERYHSHLMKGKDDVKKPTARYQGFIKYCFEKLNEKDTFGTMESNKQVNAEINCKILFEKNFRNSNFNITPTRKRYDISLKISSPLSSSLRICEDYKDFHSEKETKGVRCLTNSLLNEELDSSKKLHMISPDNFKTEASGVLVSFRKAHFPEENSRNGLTNYTIFNTYGETCTENSEMKALQWLNSVKNAGPPVENCVNALNKDSVSNLRKNLIAEEARSVNAFVPHCQKGSNNDNVCKKMISETADFPLKVYNSLDYFTCSLVINGSKCCLLKTKSYFFIMSMDVFYEPEPKKILAKCNFDTNKDIFLIAVRLCQPIRFYETTVHYLVLAAWQCSKDQFLENIYTNVSISLAQWIKNSEFHIQRIFSLIYEESLLKEHLLKPINEGNGVLTEENNWQEINATRNSASTSTTQNCLHKKNEAILFYVHGNVYACSENKAVMEVEGRTLGKSLSSVGSIFCYFNQDVAFIDKEGRFIENTKVFAQTVSAHSQSKVTYEACIYPCEKQIIFEREVTFCAAVVWRKKFPERTLKYPMLPLGNYNCTCKKALLQKASGIVDSYSSDVGILSLDTCSLSLGVPSDENVFCNFVRESAYIDKTGSIVEKSNFGLTLESKMKCKVGLNALIYPCTQQMFKGRKITYCAAFVWNLNAHPPSATLAYSLIPLEFCKDGTINSSSHNFTSLNIHKKSNSQDEVQACQLPQQNLKKVSNATSVSSESDGIAICTTQNKSNRAKMKGSVCPEALKVTTSEDANKSQKVFTKKAVSTKCGVDAYKKKDTSTEYEVEAKKLQKVLRRKVMPSKYEVMVVNCSLIIEGIWCCILKSDDTIYLMNSADFCYVSFAEHENMESLFDFTLTPFIQVSAIKLSNPLVYCGWSFYHIILAAWQSSSSLVWSTVCSYTSENLRSWTKKLGNSKSWLIYLLSSDHVMNSFFKKSKSLVMTEEVNASLQAQTDYPGCRTRNEKVILHAVTVSISTFHMNEGVFVVHHSSISSSKCPAFCYFNKDVSFINKKGKYIQDAQHFRIAVKEHSISNVTYQAYIYSCKQQVILGRNVTFCAALVWRKKFPQEMALRFPLSPELCNGCTFDERPILHEVCGLVICCSPSSGILSFISSDLSNMSLSSEQSILCHITSEVVFISRTEKSVNKGTVSETLANLMNNKTKCSALVYSCKKQKSFLGDIYYCAALVWKEGNAKPLNVPLSYPLAPDKGSGSNIAEVSYSQIQPHFFNTCDFELNLSKCLQDTCQQKILDSNRDVICNSLKLNESVQSTPSTHVLSAVPILKDCSGSFQRTKQSNAQTDKNNILSNSLQVEVSSEDIEYNIIGNRSRSLTQLVTGRIIFFDGKEGIFLAEDESKRTYCYFNDTLLFLKEKCKELLNNDVKSMMKKDISHQTKFEALTYKCQPYHFHHVELNFAVGKLWNVGERVDVSKICFPLPHIVPSKVYIGSEGSIQVLPYEKSKSEEYYSFENCKETNKVNLQISKKNLSRDSETSIFSKSKGFLSPSICMNPKKGITCTKGNIEFLTDKDAAQCETKSTKLKNIEETCVIPSHFLPVTKISAGESREFAASGIIFDIEEIIGKLQTVDQKIILFSREKCFLFGISLHNISLFHILKLGDYVEFETDMFGDIEEVWIGGGPRTTPEETFHEICLWCNKNNVNAWTKLCLENEKTMPKHFRLY